MEDQLITVPVTDSSDTSDTAPAYFYRPTDVLYTYSVITIIVHCQGWPVHTGDAKLTTCLPCGGQQTAFTEIFYLISAKLISLQKFKTDLTNDL